MKDKTKDKIKNEIIEQYADWLRLHDKPIYDGNKKESSQLLTGLAFIIETVLSKHKIKLETLQINFQPIDYDSFKKFAIENNYNPSLVARIKTVFNKEKIVCYEDLKNFCKEITIEKTPQLSKQSAILLSRFMKSKGLQDYLGTSYISNN